MDLIEKEFRNRAIIREGTYLFKASDAIDVVNKCKELQLSILGVDSFEIIGKSILPKEIYNCSNVNKGNWINAIRFIQEPFNQGLVFEVVYDS